MPSMYPTSRRFVELSAEQWQHSDMSRNNNSMHAYACNLSHRYTAAGEASPSADQRYAGPNWRVPGAGRAEIRHLDICCHAGSMTTAALAHILHSWPDTLRLWEDTFARRSSICHMCVSLAAETRTGLSQICRQWHECQWA